MAQELSDISGVGPKTEQKLNSVGIQSVQDLANTSSEEIQDEVGMSEKKASNLVQQAKESAVVIQSALDREAEYESRETISTGIEELDEILDGGWEESNIVGIYGSSGSGKTQLGHYTAVSVVEETDGEVVYIETERDRFRPERLRAFASDESVLESIHPIKAYDLDTQYNAYGTALNAFEDDLCLLVVDSFTARFRMEEDFDSRGSLSGRSTEFKKHLRRLEDVVEETGVPVLLGCQIYENPSQFGSSERIYGSSVFDHMANYFIHLTKDSGELRKATVENSPSVPEDSILFNIQEQEIVGIEE